jgi:medium-chain acyl-[acyl-carrier-protein] hydrolase
MTRASDSFVQISSGRQLPRAVVCIPHAGAGPRAYFTWKYALGGAATIWAACLPGREKRSHERPLDTIGSMADSLQEPLSGLDADEVILFGHCSGSLVAYELAHRAASDPACPRCVCLVVSAHRFPADPPDESSLIADLPLRKFTARLRRMGGMPGRLLSDPEFVAMIEPVMRADFGAAEHYIVPTGRRPLDIPVVAVGGREDGVVPSGELAGWSAATTGDFRVQLLEGSHFYFLEKPEVLYRFLRELLAALT